MEKEQLEEYKNNIVYFWKERGTLEFATSDKALEALPNIKTAYINYLAAKRLLDLEVKNIWD